MDEPVKKSPVPQSFPGGAPTQNQEAVNAKLVEVEQAQPADVVDKKTVGDIAAKQANIEIKDRVGDDNIVIFGLTADQVAEQMERNHTIKSETV